MRRRPTAPLLAALTALAAAPAAMAHGAEVHNFIQKRHIDGHVVHVTIHGDDFGGHSRRSTGSSGLRLALTSSSGSRIAALPARWCGTERASDNTENAVTDAPQVKVVYAFTAGNADRFDLYKDLIQQDVAAARSLVASSSGGSKTVRFDMGTNCPGGGDAYVDIQTVALPHGASYYTNDPVTAADRLETDLRPRLGLNGVRNVTTYVEGLNTGSTTGAATVTTDESPGSQNVANEGGLYAFVFGDGSAEFTGNRTEAFLHETTHNLGAVQDGAPHSTRAGHCWDEEDVMCYDDGGPGIPSSWPPPACPGATRFDCRNDDYFSAHPAAGSYLASHWNIYDSVFMCSVQVCNVPGADAASGATPGLSANVALAETLRRVKRTLRRLGLRGLARRRAIRVRSRAVGPGRLRLLVVGGGRKVVTGSRRYSTGGTRVLRARVTRRGRRLARRAHRVRVRIRVSFTDAGGRRMGRAAALTLPRR